MQLIVSCNAGNVNLRKGDRKSKMFGEKKIREVKEKDMEIKIHT